MAMDLAEVARVAGVSRATASQALNGKGRISESTRQRIVEVAKRLGYRGNAVARSLRTGRSKFIGIQIKYASGNAVIPNTPYFSSLIDGAAQAALEHDWLIVVVPWSTNLAVLYDLDISAGIIVNPVGNEPLLEHLVKFNGMVSCIGQLAGMTSDKSANVSYVDNNISEVMDCALGHLSDFGYRIPALLTNEVGASYVDDTVREFRRRFPKNPVSSCPIGEKHTVTKAAIGILRSRPRPDSIYTTDEEGVLAIVDAARELALDIPNDLGIVAALDTPMLANIHPPITTIDLFPEKLGQSAVKILIGLVEGKLLAPQSQLNMPFKLIPRASTKRRM